MATAETKERKPIEWWKEPTPEERLEHRRQEEFCDDRAEAYAAKTGSTRQWGRWYVKGKYLITARIMEDGRLYGKYDIPVERVDEDWVAHMLFTKSWIGKRGLRDLAEALSELRQERA